MESILKIIAFGPLVGLRATPTDVHTQARHPVLGWPSLICFPFSSYYSFISQGISIDRSRACYSCPEKSAHQVAKSHAISLLLACLHGNTTTVGQNSVCYCPLELQLCGDAIYYIWWISLPSLTWQNYFRDAWNIFDFVSVLGSITDILVTELGVSGQEQSPRGCSLLSSFAVAP